MFSADLLSRFSLSRFSQQIFSADFFSRSSQQIFSADFLSADFLSRSSQQIFSADLLSRSSQQIFSADLLSRSSHCLIICCGQGLSFAVVRGWWSAIVLSFAVVRGWWSAIILSCWWSILHEFFRRTLSRSFREKGQKSSLFPSVHDLSSIFCGVFPPKNTIPQRVPKDPHPQHTAPPNRAFKIIATKSLGGPRRCGS